MRTFNTNVVLAFDSANSRVVICTGKGVAYGLGHGDVVRDDAIEAVFVPESSPRSGALAQALGLSDPRVFDVARAICEMAGRRLGLTRPEVLVLALADHLDQAQRRAREGIVVDIPLVWEVAHLYPAELAAGHEALRIVEERLG
ncbi:PRD domain-containing protein [Nanchangia anserum]|uniref:CAT RNA binding domain-containing protein n=1 Tax=Nanchangia anserum TaxID=2692125 RepID=UPI00188318F3|nr:CAT RNA binding domain-containing protein [Nanchangia anserum]QOX82481.1 PRD domain-containing protein [Nanchangia anserum]